MKSDGTQTGNMMNLCIATVCLVLIFAASGAPIPLYSLYIENIGLTQSTVSLATLAYFVGTISSLLVFARLSNYIGRKPSIALALIASFGGCFIFFFLSTEIMMFTGRFLQGLACGVAAGSAGAYAVDNAPSKPEWLPAVITTSGPQIGLTIGALLSAFYASSVPQNLSMSFLVLAVCFVVTFIFLAFCKETIERKDGAIKSMVPRISFPKKVLPLLPACCCVFVGTWAIGGFYQAYASSMSSLLFGDSSTMLAALVFASFLAPNLFGGPLAGRLNTIAAQRLGMVTFLFAVGSITASLVFSLGGLLIVGSIFSAVTFGAAYSGAMRRILAQTKPEENASTLSGITLISYVGAAAPNLVIGFWGSSWDMLSVAQGYFVFIAFCTFMTLCLTQNRKHSLIDQKNTV